jgi:hypothetical protein
LLETHEPTGAATFAVCTHAAVSYATAVVMCGRIVAVHAAGILLVMLVLNVNSSGALQRRNPLVAKDLDE